MKPQVNLIQSQTEEINPDLDINNWEVEQLLRKYGHKPEQFSTRIEPTIQTNNLTFEEMIALQEAEDKAIQLRNQQLRTGPKPITFNNNQGYDSEVRYTSDSESGFGFKIEITTDMQLPRY